MERENRTGVEVSERVKEEEKEEKDGGQKKVRKGNRRDNSEKIRGEGGNELKEEEGERRGRL